MDVVALDQELLGRFKQGDKKAFEAVHGYFYNPLWYFANKLLNNPEDAQEIVSESFLKLFQRYDRFETFENIKAFLYITARNAGLNKIKSTGRLNAKHKRYLMTLTDSVNLETEMVRGETLNLIYKLINQLPEESQKVFKLIYFEGLSHQQVADLLGVSINTVRNQRARAVEILRKSLPEGYKLLLNIILAEGVLRVLHNLETLPVN